MPNPRVRVGPDKGRHRRATGAPRSGSRRGRSILHAGFFRTFRELAARLPGERLFLRTTLWTSGLSSSALTSSTGSWVKRSYCGRRERVSESSPGQSLIKRGFTDTEGDVPSTPLRLSGGRGAKELTRLRHLPTVRGGTHGPDGVRIHASRAFCSIGRAVRDRLVRGRGPLLRKKRSQDVP